MSRGLALPRILGGYQIEGRISEGGMGAVVLGRKQGARGFAKQAAIKVLLPQFLDSAEVQELFFSEARLAARLSHPNVCQVYDFGEQEGLYYLVMEYIRGRSLAHVVGQHMRRGDRLPLPLAAQILSASARGLHHAHSLCDDDGHPLAVVHRDVSPQNVLITFEGHIKVLDFGIAKSRDRTTATQQGILRGKPAYMSPEQARGDPLDARSDIFSLGTVFYEMCTHRNPFGRDNVYATIQAIGSETASDPRKDAPDLPEAAARIINCALNPDREQRFASAEVMARALDQMLLQLGQPVSEATLAAHVAMLFPDGPDPVKPVAHGRTASQSTLPLIDADENALTVGSDAGPQPVAQIDGSTGAVIRQARGSRRVIAALTSVLLVIALSILTLRLLDPGQGSGPSTADAASAEVKQPKDVSIVVAVLDAAIAPDAASRPTPRANKKTRRHARRPRLDPPANKKPGSAAVVTIKPPTSQVETYGSLSVPGANPYFNVRLDGRLLGATPIIRREVAVGMHQIVIEDPSTGRQVLKKNVNILEGINRRVSEHLAGNK